MWIFGIALALVLVLELVLESLSNPQPILHRASPRLAPLLRLVRGNKEHRTAKIGVEQAGMSD